MFPLRLIAVAAGAALALSALPARALDVASFSTEVSPCADLTSFVPLLTLVLSFPDSSTVTCVVAVCSD